jgi:lambda repressor-like predicted transcriptional regulator
MARPQKQTETHRPHRLSVRVSADELAAFTERVKLAGVNPSEYLRQAALRRRVSVPSAARRADPLVIAELNRIGVNLNQLTKTANSTGKVPPALDQLCRKIEEIVMRAIGREVDS